MLLFFFLCTRSIVSWGPALFAVNPSLPLSPHHEPKQAETVTEERASDDVAAAAADVGAKPAEDDAEAANTTTSPRLPTVKSGGGHSSGGMKLSSPPSSPRLHRILSEQRSFTGARAAETATILPSVFGPIEDKELELAVLAKGREVELTRLMQQQQKVYTECVDGALRCQSLVERKEQLQARLVEEAGTNAAAVRAIKENHEIIKQRTRELHLKNIAANHARAGATDSDLFNSQEHQRRLQERRFLDMEHKLVTVDKALRNDRSKAAHHLLRSATERRRLEAGNEARAHSLADKKAAEADISARLQRALSLAPSKEEFGLLMPHAADVAVGVEGATVSSESSPRLELDLGVLGRSVLDVDQFDTLRTAESRRKCLELLEERFAQLSSLVSHLRKLVGATKTVHSDLELQKAWDKIEMLASDACEGAGARILLVEGGGGTENNNNSNNSQQLPHLYRYVGDDVNRMAQAGITARVIVTGRTEVVADVKRDAGYRGAVDNPTGGGCKSLIVAPIWGPSAEEDGQDKERKVIGVLQVVNKIKGDFNAKDELFAGLLAAMAATAVSNARSYADVMRRRARNRALLEAGRALASSVDQKTVLDRAVVETRRIMRAESVLIWSFPPSPPPGAGARSQQPAPDPNSSSTVFDDQFSDPMVDSRMFGGGFEATARRCVAEGTVLAVPDAFVDDAFSAEFDRRVGVRTRSVLCAPVMGTTGSPLGAIVCVNKLPEQAAASAGPGGAGKASKSGGGGGESLLVFDADDEEAVGTLAAQIGVALENAILFMRASQVPDVSGDMEQTLSINDAGRLVLDRALALCPCHSARLCVVGFNGDGRQVWCLDGDDGGDGAWVSLPSGSMVERVLTSGKAVNRSGGGGGGGGGAVSASLTGSVDLPGGGEGGDVTSLLYAPLPLLVAAAGAGGGGGRKEGSMRASGVLILANKKEPRGGAGRSSGNANAGPPVFDRMDEYLVGGYLSSAAVVVKAAQARELSTQAEARREVLFHTIHRLYGHELDLGGDMPRAPFEEFAAAQVAALLPGVSLKVCWPKAKEEGEAGGEGEEEGEEGKLAAAAAAVLPVFEDEEAAAAAAARGARASSRQPAEDGQALVTHVLAAPVKTAAGAVRCCLVASREGGRSFSRAEVEALTVFSGHCGLCMD
jgi:GAF domain-containing protein